MSDTKQHISFLNRFGKELKANLIPVTVPLI